MRIRKIYKTYQSIVKENPISQEKFSEIFLEQQKVVNFLLHLGKKKPYTISQLDDGHVLFCRVVNPDNMTMNIWSNKEAEALTGYKPGREKP